MTSNPCLKCRKHRQTTHHVNNQSEHHQRKRTHASHHLQHRECTCTSAVRLARAAFATISALVADNEPTQGNWHPKRTAYGEDRLACFERNPRSGSVGGRSHRCLRCHRRCHHGRRLHENERATPWPAISPQRPMTSLPGSAMCPPQGSPPCWGPQPTLLLS